MTGAARRSIILPMRLRHLPRLLICLAVGIALLTTSSAPAGDALSRARAYTRPIEFEFVSWTLEALWLKLGQGALGTAGYLEASQRSEIVLEYLDLILATWWAKYDILVIYADPEVADPQQASAERQAELDALNERRVLLEPLAEAVLQEQVSEVAADFGLSLGGQPIPPVLFHITPPPYSLIISPREVIRKEFDVSLSPEMAVEEMELLEAQVDGELNVSSLVVGIGGIGTYPAMVMETNDILWLASTVAHEWVHNYLTLRPLGASYLASPELRTMNETTASIAGDEIGYEVVQRYYPEYLPEPVVEEQEDVTTEPTPAPQPPAFDINAEMRQTRLETDALLAAGQIEEAEAYMEARRAVFWENGYRFRKLNQAYFAFYGAYADQPGGAAGEDPVGAAVRDLRAQSASLAEFLNQISWMWQWEQLQQAVGSG